MKFTKQKLSVDEASILSPYTKFGRELFGAILQHEDENGWVLIGLERHGDIAETILSEYYKRTMASLRPVEAGAEAMREAYREAFAAGWKACAEAIAAKHDRWASLCDARAEICLPLESENIKMQGFRHRNYARTARNEPVEFPDDMK